VKRKLDTRTLSILVGVGLLLYGAAGYFLFVSPKKGESVRLGEQIAAANVELATARAASQVKDDTQPITVADIFRLATAMPSTPDMPGILLELSRIADETGIRFKSITPQSAVPVGAYQSVPIEVTFDGSFYALSDFLFRLRTLVLVRRGELHAAGRLFSVQSVDFVEGDSGFPMLGATLKLQAYVYGTDTSGATLPTPADPSATPPATDGAAVPPATDGTATAAGATG
jgi:hypothetical protein